MCSASGAHSSVRTSATAQLDRVEERGAEARPPSFNTRSSHGRREFECEAGIADEVDAEIGERGPPTEVVRRPGRSPKTAR